MAKTHTILVVDDESSMLRYMQTMLELESFRVETAVNGLEAVKRIERGQVPDLVFLDLLMPELDGLQALERMRKRRPDLKVVMLSCVSDTAKVVQAMRLGAQDYLTKPFQKAELDAVINQCLGQGKETFTGEVEELTDAVLFIAASPPMR